MAARNKDVRRKRIVLGFHCRKLGVDITYRRSELLQCILKARRLHKCSDEHVDGLQSSGHFNDNMQISWRPSPI